MNLLILGPFRTGNFLSTGIYRMGQDKTTAQYNQSSFKGARDCYLASVIGLNVFDGIT